MKSLVFVAFLSLFYCFSSCKKEPSNFEILEPFLGEYKAKGWVLYPEEEFNLKHTVTLKKNGKYQLKIEGNPIDIKARIKSVGGGASSSPAAFFDYYFSIDFHNENEVEELVFEDTTMLYKFDFTTSPNPAQESVLISSNTAITELSIIDVFGNVVRTERGLLVKNYRLNISNYKPGVYFVNCKNETNQWCSKKIIKL